MRWKATYLLCLLMVRSFSQQFPHYTQFTFNKIGYNPAASGSSLAAPYEFIIGARTQWVGVSNNPKSLFVSFNYNFVPQHGYHSWHNVGGYIGQDQNGNFVHNDVWLSYSWHTLITGKMVLGVGVFAGMKQYKLTLQNLDAHDPAVQRSAGSVIKVPDIVPGVRLQSKKFFADACLQHVSIYSQKGIGGAIGSPSKIWPHYNLTSGYKAKLNYYNTAIFAANLRGSFIGLPSLELNVIDYVSNVVAFGASVRGRNFVSGIVQFRIGYNLVVGLACDLSINKMYYAAPLTGEIMIAFTPVFGGETMTRKTMRVVDDCTF